MTQVMGYKGDGVGRTRNGLNCWGESTKKCGVAGVGTTGKYDRNTGRKLGVGLNGPERFDLGSGAGILKHRQRKKKGLRGGGGGK